MTQETLSQNQLEAMPQTQAAQQQLEPTVVTCDNRAQVDTCSPLQDSCEDLRVISQLLDEIKIKIVDGESQDKEIVGLMRSHSKQEHSAVVQIQSQNQDQPVLQQLQTLVEQLKIVDTNSQSSVQSDSQQQQQQQQQQSTITTQPDAQTPQLQSTETQQQEQQTSTGVQTATSQVEPQQQQQQQVASVDTSVDTQPTQPDSQQQQPGSSTATQPVPQAPEVVKKVFKCYICDSEIEENGKDYDLCGNNHRMCSGCIKSYVNVVLAEPQHKLPPKCSSCYRPIPIQKLLNVLEGQQLECLNNLLVINTVNTQIIDLIENQVLVACPFCQYVEIRDEKDVNFIFCQNPLCMKRSCFYCHLEIPYKPCCSEDEDRDLKKHFDCYLIHEFKKEIEDAIESGMKVSCPDCNTAGRKDPDTCTHMTCIKCSSMYCYFCGESADTCIDDDSGDLYVHNNDWRTKSSKCPMYFNEIWEIDDRWPKIDEHCLNYFHELKILWNVREVCFKFGKDKVVEFEESYGLLERSGIDLKRILNEDIEFINRNNTNDNDDDQEDEEEE